MAKTSPSNAERVSLIPGWGVRIPHASWPNNQNIKTEAMLQQMSRLLLNVGCSAQNFLARLFCPKKYTKERMQLPRAGPSHQTKVLVADSLQTLSLKDICAFKPVSFRLLLFSSSVVSNSFVTLWTVSCRAPLSMGFPRQEYWSRLPIPSPGVLPDPGIEPVSPALQMDFFFFFFTVEWFLK